MEAAIESWDRIRSQLRAINGPKDLVHQMEILLVRLIHIVIDFPGLTLFIILLRTTRHWTQDCSLFCLKLLLKLHH